MNMVKTVMALPEDCPIGGNEELVPVMYIVIEGQQEVADFKKLVQNGSSLYPDLSPAMKEIADLITTGKIQQPYRSRSE